VPGDLLTCTGVADADAQPVERAVVAERGDDVAQAVVAAVTAVELEAHLAGRKIQLVVGNQQLLSAGA
jgi:hypothetical protein